MSDASVNLLRIILCPHNSTEISMNVSIIYYPFLAIHGTKSNISQIKIILALWSQKIVGFSNMKKVTI